MTQNCRFLTQRICLLKILILPLHFPKMCVFNPNCCIFERTVRQRRFSDNFPTIFRQLKICGAGQLPLSCSPSPATTPPGAERSRRRIIYARWSVRGPLGIYRLWRRRWPISHEGRRAQAVCAIWRLKDGQTDVRTDGSKYHSLHCTRRDNRLFQLPYIDTPAVGCRVGRCPTRDYGIGRSVVRRVQWISHRRGGHRCNVDDDDESTELVFAHSYSKNSHECANKICSGKQFSL